MTDDRSWDDEARTEMEAWSVLWEVRTLLLSVPLARRKELMETAIKEANRQHPDYPNYEQEVRAFMADILVGE